MLIMPSFQKSLIVEQFQGNYLKQPFMKIQALKLNVNQQNLNWTDAFPVMRKKDNDYRAASK